MKSRIREFAVARKMSVARYLFVKGSGGKELAKYAVDYALDEFAWEFTNQVKNSFTNALDDAKNVKVNKNRVEFETDAQQTLDRFYHLMKLDEKEELINSKVVGDLCGHHLNEVASINIAL